MSRKALPIVGTVFPGGAQLGACISFSGGGCVDPKVLNLPAIRSEPDIPKWEGRCRVDFGQFMNRYKDLALTAAQIERRLEESEMAFHRVCGYTGENQKLGDYYVREIERIGTERRQVVVYEVVGTGRVERLARTKFERQVRAA